MAIPNKYIDKIKDQDSGESRPICPPAEHVQVDNENFEGETLDEVLDEVAQAIEDAGQGGYAPPQGGIPKSDLAQSVQDSLDKADSALQDDDVAEVAKTGDYNDLENKPSIPDTSGLATKTEVANKQDKLQAGNGIVIGNDGKTVSVAESIRTGAAAGSTAVQSVSVESEEDGTVDIHVDDDTYSINLNHEHQGMAKLEKHTPATMPDVEDMEEDTIYAEVEDGEVNVLYIGGIPFYGGGGGTSTPVLRQPADGSTIDVGTIESGESSVSKTITVKGKSLTQALTVAVTGTGYSVNKQSISAADANVGTTLTITCTNTDDNAAGTLSLASSEVSCDCDLVANIPTYEDLRGVKLTGSQWMQTDYKPNANTEFRLICRFEQRSDTQSTNKDNYEGNIFSVTPGPSNKWFYLRNPAATPNDLYNPWNTMFVNESSVNYGNDVQMIGIGGNPLERQQFLVDPVEFYYTKGSTNGTIGFTDGTHTRTKPTSLKTSTQENAMMIGRTYNPSNNKDMMYSIWNLTIYEFVITENGNEVRHWVPKVKNGIPGLYDTVNNTFISSETSTELVAVPLT